MNPSPAPRVTNPRRLAIFAGLGLVIILALLFSARDLVREMVVLPLSYLFWSVGVFVDTTPQIFFWIAVLLLAGLAAYRSLVGRGKVLAETPPEVDGPDGIRSLRGQVGNWSVKVNLLRQGQSKYFQSTFHQAVGKLLMDTLAYRFHLTQNQLEDLLRDSTLEVPAAVRDYALKSLRPGEVIPSSSFLARYWSALVDLFRSWFAPAPPPSGPVSGANMRYSQDEQQVLEVLKYIEGELEVPHDDTGQ